MAQDKSKKGDHFLFEYVLEKKQRSIGTLDSLVKNQPDVGHNELYHFLKDMNLDVSSLTNNYDDEIFRGLLEHSQLVNKKISLQDFIKSIKTIPFKENSSRWRALFFQRAAAYSHRERDYKEAITLSKKVLVELKNDTVYKPVASHFLIANSLYRLGARDSLNFYARKAYNLSITDTDPDPYAIAETSWSAGIYAQSSGNTEESQEYLQNAVAYHLQSYGENARFVSKIAVLADSYFYNWDLKKAEFYGNQGLKIVEKLGKDNLGLYERSLLGSSLARIYYSQGKIEESRQQIAPIVEECKQTYKSGSALTVAMMRTQANVEIAADNSLQAEKILLEAEEVAEKVDRLYTKTGVYNELSHLYEFMDRHEKAIEYLKKEEDLLKKDSFYDSELGAYNLLKQVHNYIDLDSLERASTSSEVLKQWLENDNSRSRTKLDAKIALQRQLLFKATVSKKPEDYKIARDFSENLITTFINDKSELDLEGSKIFYGEIIALGLQGAMDIYYNDLINNESEENFTNTLRILEINKSSTLLDGLRDISLKSKYMAPKSLKDLEATLVKQRVKEESSCNGNMSSDCATRILKFTESLDSIKEVYKSQYPNYYRARTMSLSEPISHYQEKLIDKNTLVLEYALFQDWLYRLDITSKTVKLHRVEMKKEIPNALKALRTNLQNRAEFTTELETLSQSLLPAEISESINKIIIVADRELALIPFDILTHKNEFLTERYAISYAGSLQLLYEQKRQHIPRRSKWLGYAPSYDAETLSSNTNEVEIIAAAMGGEVVTGQEATKSSFLSQASEYNVLHLAAHGELDAQNPMNNKFVFAGKKNNTLTLQEIYGLDLRANMAVLSACNTGNGKVEVGDGVMSLSRAFHYAGVSSTVTSLWKVPDQETSKIMVSFYTYLQEGYSKDIALQKAKLDYLNTVDDPELTHPYYWAGFVLTGNTEPFGKPSPWQWYAILAILGIVCIGGVVYFKIRSSKGK